MFGSDVSHLLLVWLAVGGAVSLSVLLFGAYARRQWPQGERLWPAWAQVALGTVLPWMAAIVLLVLFRVVIVYVLPYAAMPRFAPGIENPVGTLPTVIAALSFGALLLTAIAALGYGTLLFRDYIRQQWKRGEPLCPSQVQAPADAVFPWVVGAGLLFLLPSFYGCAAVILVGWLCMTLFWRPEKAAWRRKEQAQLLKDLAVAIERSLPITDYFDTVAGDQHGRLARQIKHVAAKLRQGIPLSAALDETRFLPYHAVLAIRAAELSGGKSLVGVLRGVADDLNQESDSRSAMLLWVIYPLALFSLWLPLAFFHGLCVIPNVTRLASALHLKNGPLWWWPWFERGFFWGTIGVAAVFIILGAAAAAPEGVSAFPFRPDCLAHSLAGGLPFFRRRQRHRALARSTRTLSAMLNAGVPFSEACLATQELAGPFGLAFQRLADGAEQGEPWGSLLQNAGLPAASTQLLQVGAAGNAFPAALDLAAQWHESHARRLDRWITATLPFITIPLCGLTVGALYIGLFEAILAVERSMVR